MLYEYGDGYIGCKVYWYIDCNGEICRKVFNFEDIDYDRYYGHNTFGTKEAAIRQRDRLIAEGKLKKTIGGTKMNKVEELENKIEQQKKEVNNAMDELIAYKDELELEKAKEKAKLKFPFKKGEKPYVLESYGDIRILDIKEDIESTSTVEFTLYSAGCLFEDHVEAMEEFCRRHLLTEIKTFRNNCNGDWKPDFRVVTEDKWCIQKDIFGLEAKAVNQDVFNVFGYFKNEEDCIMAIRLFKADIEWLF
nr:MAG TPA: hypothetical protein [Caudoviricetes sp.]